jgi:hypothetical protein
VSALTYIVLCALVPLVWSVAVARVLGALERRRRRKQAEAAPPPDYTI